MLLSINFEHSKPSGEDGSMNALHISTTTKAGNSPNPRKCESSFFKFY